MSSRHKPIHPGEVLKHDFMDPMQITAYRLAKDIGVSAASPATSAPPPSSG